MSLRTLSVPAVLAACGLAFVAFAVQPPATPAETKPAEAKPAATAPAVAAPAPKADEPKALNRVEVPGGVITEDLVMGTGAEVKNNAVVMAHYRGTLKADGTEFDSSYKRGEPAIFPLKGLIEGWQDGIPGMKVGGKRRLTIPFTKAYGEAGRPPVIPAKADLVFEIEIIDMLVVEDERVGEGEAYTMGQGCSIKYAGKPFGAEKASMNGGVETAAVSTAPSISCDGKACEIPFQLMIPALQFGLDGMKVGGKRKLVFPAAMGWQQKPSPMGDAAKMELEVELVSLMPAQGMGGMGR